MNNLPDDFLQCPRCKAHQFSRNGKSLNCLNCLTIYPLYNGVPIFLENSSDTKVFPLEHTSNQMPREAFSWLEKLNGYSLNIGAGATQVKLSQSIELEYSIYKNTDIVADAHFLPFRDEVFDAVVSFNTLEHLYDPCRAVKEIFRVLKPGGKVFIHTAFMQPLHQEPVHYYNATKYGLLNWFSLFEIEDCSVSWNFNPLFTVSWLLHSLLYYTELEFGVEVKNKLGQTTLDEWSKMWEFPEARSGFVWDTMQQLSQKSQERFAAGFELRASKPK